MKFLSEADFKIGFITGIIMHLIMIWTRIRFRPLRCIDGDCGEIVIFDIPMSILYYAFDPDKILVLSLLFGSVYYGFLFWLILRVIKKIFERGR